MQVVRWDDTPSDRVGDLVERRVLWGEKGTLARIQLTRGAHVLLHRHPAEQFSCVLAGALRLKWPGGDVVLRAGDMLVIPGDVQHEAWALEDTIVWDFFAPPRQDWQEGKVQYLAGR